MKQVISFAGGGSGGHIFPIRSLIKSLDKERYKILWFGTKGSLEEKISNQLKNEGFDIIFLPILAGKIRRQKDIRSIYKNFVDLFNIIGGFFQSFFYILKYKPKFVFSKGGFVAFSPSLAGKILGKKIYLHESDTVPGLVNKAVGKFAARIYLGFDSAKKYFPKNKTVVIGQILDDKFYLGLQDNDKQVNSEKGKVRNRIAGGKQDIRMRAGLQDGKTNLLVIGGSQGAKVIIQAIKNLLSNGKLKDFNIFVVGGLLNKENIFYGFENVKFYEFLSQDDLIKLYEKADISVTRGSATSLAEQDQFDIKKIIVPLPYTGGNHQYYNALEYEKKGDILLSQLNENFEEKLGKILEKFAGYKKKKGQYRREKDGKKIILKEIL